MKNFRTYELAKSLYQQCKREPVKGEVRNQLNRASLSVCLNLAEGSAKESKKERRRFYSMAFASLREVQALIDLEGLKLTEEASVLGAHLYNLIKSISP